MINTYCEVNSVYCDICVRCHILCKLSDDILLWERIKKMSNFRFSNHVEWYWNLQANTILNANKHLLHDLFWSVPASLSTIFFSARCLHLMRNKYVLYLNWANNTNWNANETMLANRQTCSEHCNVPLTVNEIMIDVCGHDSWKFVLDEMR